MENTNKPALIVATEMAMQLLHDSSSTLAKLALINMPEGTTQLQAERRVLKELTNFEMICNLKPELANLDKGSIVMAVKQCICDNLTLSPAAGLVYLYPGKVCIGTNGSQKIYKDILCYEPSSEGHLSISRQTGALLDHKRPEVSFDSEGRVSSVKFEFLVPAYPKPRWECAVFDTNDFERWRLKSAAKYNGNANASYTNYKGGIDPEFARAKAIKHGLKKRGRNANEIIVPVVNSEEPEAKNDDPEVKDVEFVEVKNPLVDEALTILSEDPVKVKEITNEGPQLPDTDELF